MKHILLPVFPLLFAFPVLKAQHFCFYNPNQGPHYHNASQGIYDVTAADFNGDNHLDIVTANSTGNNISFIPGNGLGALGTPDTFAVSGTAFAIAHGDFNSDGMEDIATACPGIISVLAGNGDGTFQPAVHHAAGGAPSRLYVADLNADSIPDLVEANWSNVFVLLGQGNGNFAPFTEYITGGNVNDLTIADFNGDSISDIAATNRVLPTVAVISYLEGNGDGTFANVISIPSADYHLFGIVSHDFNQDQYMDIATTYFDFGTPLLGVWMGNGDGTFASPVLYPSALASPVYLCAEDMDNDLVADLVVIEPSGFSVYKGNPDGTLDSGEYFLGNSGPNSIVTGDFNEDGRMDIVEPSSGMGIIIMELNCFSPSTALPDEQEIPGFSVYPNPSNGSISLAGLENTEWTAGITDMTGRNIWTGSGSGNTQVQTTLQKGYYFLQVIIPSTGRLSGQIICVY